MSKPETPAQPVTVRAPKEQVRFFADSYRHRVSPQSQARLNARVAELELNFPNDDLVVVAALDTPERVEEFLSTQLYYNNDHEFPGQEETALSPRRVLQTSMAHCFEGALFAYAINFLHGHTPQMVLLEASEDSDHNLVVYQNPQTRMYGCNAHSRFPHLDGRRAAYPSIRALAESYAPYYYSDRTFDPNDRTLVGYSDPFDVVKRYGTAWMDSEEPLWEIYFTYIDDSIRFHYLFDDSDETHSYPMLTALQEGWIQVDTQGKPYVSPSNLPEEARPLWDAFWRAFDAQTIAPRGEAKEITAKFFQLLKVSPLDLQEYAEELQKFFKAGYRVEQLFRKSSLKLPRA